MDNDEKRYLETVTRYYKTVTNYLRNYTYEGREIGFDIFVIDFLENNPSCSMSEITEYLNVKSPGTATKRIDRLVDFGFVERTVSKNDRRMVELLLTKSGKSLYRDFLRNRMNAMELIMNHFNKEELDIFLDIIERLLELHENFKFSFYPKS